MLLVLTVTVEQQWGSPTTVANVRPAAWTPCGPWTEVLLVKLVVKAHGLGEFWLPVTRPKDTFAGRRPGGSTTRMTR